MVKFREALGLVFSKVQFSVIMYSPSPVSDRIGIMMTVIAVFTSYVSFLVHSVTTNIIIIMKTVSTNENICVILRYSTKTEVINTRGPSQYKYHLSQVWGYPC